MTESPKLIFREPPAAAPRGRTSPVNAWLGALKEHPGKWAEYPEPMMSSGIASTIRKGARNGIEAGEYEAVCRPTTNKRHLLFARYVGDPS